MLEYLQALSPKTSLVKVALICANYVLGFKKKKKKSHVRVLGFFFGFVNERS